jgi:fucose permease
MRVRRQAVRRAVAFDAAVRQYGRRMLATARWAVSTMFFVNGAVLASWLPHIPDVKRMHAISDGVLGLVLLAMAVGAVFALPAAGALVGRFGSRRMTTVSAVGLCLALPLPVLAPTVPALALALLVLGACNGLLDVSMNAQAVLVERAQGRAIMSSFHALFSLGGLVGAALASSAMQLGAGPAGHVVPAAVVALTAVLAARPALVPSPAHAVADAPIFARPSGVLLGFGLLAFAGLLAEGAMGDWSAVYLRDALGATPAAAGGGFAVFSLAMAAGRFGGDAVVRRLGPAYVLRVSSALAAVGLGGALALGRPLAGIVGCGLVGIGIANVIPILFSAAARVPDVQPGAAIAAVATTGYLGLLAGPPLIGLAAEAIGLPAALGIVAVLCAAIALAGGIVDDLPGPAAVMPESVRPGRVRP